jgi:hypothetical protein
MNINEEINRVRLMMNYNSKTTLTENYNLLNRITINEQGAAFKAIAKDLATVTKNETSSVLKTLEKAEAAGIKDTGINLKGLQTTAGQELRSLSEIIDALKAGTLGPSGVGNVSKAFFLKGTTSELRAIGADSITSMSKFNSRYSKWSKEQIVKDLERVYSPADAEVLTNNYLKKRGKLSSAEEIGTTVKTGEKVGAEEIGTTVKGSEKAGAEEIGTTVKTGEKTGAKQPKKPKTKSGKEIESLTDDEIKGMSKSESEQIMKETEDFYKQADENVLKSERARAERKALETERELLANKKLAAEEAKTLAKESPSKFKLWAKTKGLLRWTYRWTIGNKWFWILGGGTIAGYWLWNNWFKDNGIGITEDPGIDIPSTDGDTTVDIGGSGPGTSQETTDWMNDPNAGDGDPGDPLFGKYKKCKEPYKIGCMTTGAYPLIQKMQRYLGLKPTGKWGKKTDLAVRNEFGVSEMTDDEIRDNANILDGPL